MSVRPQHALLSDLADVIIEHLDDDALIDYVLRKHRTSADMDAFVLRFLAAERASQRQKISKLPACNAFDTASTYILELGDDLVIGLKYIDSSSCGKCHHFRCAQSCDIHAFARADGVIYECTIGEWRQDGPFALHVQPYCF